MKRMQALVHIFEDKTDNIDIQETFSILEDTISAEEMEVFSSFLSSELKQKIYRILGMPDQADEISKQILRKLQASSDIDVRALFSASKILIDDEYIEDFTILVSKALTRFPDNQIVWLLKAKCLYFEDKHEQALLWCNKITQLPLYLKALSIMFYCYFYDKEFEKALSIAKHWYDISPEFDTAILAMGDSHGALEMYTTALKYYKNVTEMYPDDGMHHTAYGYINMLENNDITGLKNFYKSFNHPFKRRSQQRRAILETIHVERGRLKKLFWDLSI